MKKFNWERFSILLLFIILVNGMVIYISFVTLDYSTEIIKAFIPCCTVAGLFLAVVASTRNN